jgi:hypothetical protein
MSYNVLLEGLIVGICTAILGFIISTLIMFFSIKDFSREKYHYWYFILLSYFITGFLFHIICEGFRINTWYCTNGNACKK